MWMTWDNWEARYIMSYDNGSEQFSRTENKTPGYKYKVIFLMYTRQNMFSLTLTSQENLPFSRRKKWTMAECSLLLALWLTQLSSFHSASLLWKPAHVWPLLGCAWQASEHRRQAPECVFSSIDIWDCSCLSGWISSCCWLAPHLAAKTTEGVANRTGVRISLV